MLIDDSPSRKLAGIARLATSSRLLEAKRRVAYFELPARRFINRCASDRVPFQWTINPYRGCEFGCRYCYARYTHEFLELRGQGDFEKKIFAKRFNATAFREELRRISRRDWIAIGAATDPYQPAERRCRVTRQILEVLATEKGRKLSIATKSGLVTRDLGLLKTIARANALRVSVTITTLEEGLARTMEPNAPPPALRLEAVRALALAGLKVGVLACPVLPLLNDGEEMLNKLAAAAASAGACCFGGGVVFLKPSARRVFLPFLREKFPHLARRYWEHFQRSAFLTGAYPKTIAARLAAAGRRHGLAHRFPDDQPELWPGDPQLELPFGGGGTPREGKYFS